MVIKVFDWRWRYPLLALIDGLTPWLLLPKLAVAVPVAPVLAAAWFTFYYFLRHVVYRTYPR